MDAGTTKYDHFMKCGAWTYCPARGRRRADGNLRWDPRVQQPCDACDVHPELLSHKKPADFQRDKRASKPYYVTPDIGHWPRFNGDAGKFEYRAEAERDEEYLSWPSMLDLTADEAKSISLVDLCVDIKFLNSGGAPIKNFRKMSVTEARWKPAPVATPAEPAATPAMTPRAQAAVDWLTANNDVYRHYVGLRRDALASGQPYIRTAQLLLRMDGIEVAARPDLYPWPACADTGIKARLNANGWEATKPSIKKSIMRKLSCRVADFYSDFHLLSLLYDICNARNIMGMMGVAEKTERSPENFTVTDHGFEGYWRNQASVLVDRVRQRGFPTLFLTCTVAEWKFPLLSAVFARYKKAGRLTSIQGPLTMHAYNVFGKVLDDFLRKEAVPKYFRSLADYSYRVEFQGRGTLHIHLVAWVDLDPVWQHPGTPGRYILAGRTFLVGVVVVVVVVKPPHFFCNQELKCRWQHPQVIL